MNYEYHVTLDDRVYPMLTEKLKALDTVVDNKNDRTLEGEKQHVVYEDLGDALDILVPE